MKSLVSIVVAAAFAFTSSTFAQESIRSDADIRYVIARADATSVGAEIAVEPAVLEEYAGRYETASGVAFIIVQHGDFLAIELPESSGLAQYRLRATSTRDFLAAEVPVSVAFQTDNDGHVNALLIYPPDGHAIPAAKAHGIVTIYDVYADAASVKIAASN